MGRENPATNKKHSSHLNASVESPLLWMSSATHHLDYFRLFSLRRLASTTATTSHRLAPLEYHAAASSTTSTNKFSAFYPYNFLLLLVVRSLLEERHVRGSVATHE